MSIPNSITQCSKLSSEFQATMNAYLSMMNYAQQFICAANILALDPNFSIASQEFKDWGALVLPQVTSFVQNTPEPPSA